MPVFDAVLFDFGGIFTVSPLSTAREAGAEIGLEMHVAMELCFGPYHDDTDHPWHRLERGELSLEETHRQLVEIAAARGLEIDPLEFLFRLGAGDPHRSEIVERALAVKGTGAATALVTNNVIEWGDAWRKMVPVDELFDVVIDSCRVGVRKPDPRIYQLALDALGVEAERAIFLDDHAANVVAAELLGMRGIVVGHDRLAAFDELESLLREETRA